MRLVYMLLVSLGLISACNVTDNDTKCSIIKSNFSNGDDCKNYYQVSNCFEDTSLNSDLSCFLFNTFVGGDSFAEYYDYNALFHSSEFADIILMFYKGKFNHLKNRESESDWEESYIELLFKCSDKAVLYKIADSLLVDNNSDGLVALWSDINIKKLNYYTSYTNYVQNLDNNGLYTKLELCIIAHNITDFDNRDLLLKQIKEIDFSIWEQLDKAIKEMKNIDYDFYNNLYY